MKMKQLRVQMVALVALMLLILCVMVSGLDVSSSSDLPTETNSVDRPVSVQSFWGNTDSEKQDIRSWRGDWDNGIRYRAGDIVSSGGSAWISMRANNKNSLPTETNVRWNLIDRRGDVGLSGDKGDTGARGDAGAPGSAGRDGTDGTPGTPGQNGLPGAAGIKGDMGGDGPRGSDGMDGAPGPQGDDGAPGPAGTNGLPGSKGDSGATGSFSSEPTFIDNVGSAYVDLSCRSQKIVVNGTRFTGTIQFPIVANCPDVRYDIIVTDAPVKIGTARSCGTECIDTLGEDVQIQTINVGISVWINDAVKTWFVCGHTQSVP